MPDLTVALTIASALGTGIKGGVFFGFSTFVMRAVGVLPTHGKPVSRPSTTRVGGLLTGKSSND
jgi:uncharacterized membrane protein